MELHIGNHHGYCHQEIHGGTWRSGQSMAMFAGDAGSLTIFFRQDMQQRRKMRLSGADAWPTPPVLGEEDSDPVHLV